MKTIDHGISLTYQDASLDTVSKMLDQALAVANKNLVGKPVSDVKSLLEIDSYGLKPFVKEGCLYAGGLCLEIGKGSEIVRVRAE